MKHDLYEMFSGYEGELPEIKEEPCNTGRIKQLVIEGTQKKRHIKHIRPKMFIICAAAALTAVSGITVAAATDGFSRFRSILHKTEPGANLSEELPLMKNDDISGMEQNISEKCTVFNGTDSMTVSTVGMYYDNNTLMLSVAMKLNKAISIPDNTIVLPYFSMVNDGVRTELPDQSGLGNAAHLTHGDESDTYYATFYLTEKDITASSIGITLKNFITTDDAANIQSLIISEQESWRNEYDLSVHTVNEWKQYWKENNFDKRTRDKIEEYISECTKVLDGEWSADIEISESSESLTFRRTGFTVKADTLSLTLDSDKELPEFAFAVPVVTMNDGTVIYDGGTNEEKWFSENGVLSQNSRNLHYAHRFGNVFSYNEPFPVSNIKNISVYVFDNTNGVSAERFIIYDADLK